MGEPSSLNYNVDDYVVKEEVEEEENEEVEEEYNFNKNKKKKGERSSRHNAKDQINECQLKLFGKEQPKKDII